MRGNNGIPLLAPGKKSELTEVLRQLIRLDSSNPPGNELPVASYMAGLLAENGLKGEIYESEPGRANLYARFGESDAPPILLLSHIDVVPAPGDWRHPPFEAVDDNGTIYGRGTLDTKHLTAMQLMSMIWLKREGFVPGRPIILLATADEENGSALGMEYMANNYPHLIPPGDVISEGGGFVIEYGDTRLRTCTCGEKGACKLTVSVENDRPGPSLDPENSLAGKVLDALDRLAGYDAPVQMNGVTERFLEAVDGVVEDPTLKRLWEYSSRPCMVIDAHDLAFDAGEAQKALSLGVTYQFIHGTGQGEIEGIVADTLGSVAGCKADSFSEGYECTVGSPFFRMLEETSQQLDPGTRMLPMLALGRTDGRFIRHNVYGYSPMLGDIPFAQVLKKVHQVDECITVDSLCYGAAVLYETLRRAAGQ